MDFRAWARAIILSALVGVLSGCDSEKAGSSGAGQIDLFAPTAMRIHPIFTQLTDWNHSGKIDGVEAQLEFTDQFGDPTKASGKVLFELFDLQKDSAEPRGRRLKFWVGSLTTQDEQRHLWNTTLRTYRFQLDYPGMSRSQSYVLTAVFELASGGRFFDRIVLAGHPAEKPDHKSPAPMGGL